MPACSFCKKQYENPRGLTLFTFDGKSLFYCSSKCRRNADLGRDPKKTSWVKKEKKVKEVSNKNIGNPKTHKAGESKVNGKVTDIKNTKEQEKVEKKVETKEESKAEKKSEN